MKQVAASITSCSEPFLGAHLLQIHSPEIASESRPGQFVTVCCGDEVLLRRPFSIHRVRDEHIELLFAQVGQGTRWLAARNKGEALDILGPLGNGFEIYPDSRNLLLAGGGIGIAPLIYLAEKAVSDGFSVKLVIGAKTKSGLFSEVLQGAEIIQITEDGSAGEKGIITDMLPPLVEWADQIFTCGPVPMYNSMAGRSDEFKGKSVQILMEQVMACGVGACRGCAVTTHEGIKMVCCDGPVFELQQIVWGNNV